MLATQKREVLPIFSYLICILNTKVMDATLLLKWFKNLTSVFQTMKSHQYVLLHTGQSTQASFGLFRGPAI